MATVPVLMPQLGESIAEATIIRLGVKVGDAVRADQEIIEVETNKAVMGVTTICNGTVTEIRAQEGVSYNVGSVLALLEVTDDEIRRTGVDTLETYEKRSNLPGIRRSGGEAPTSAPAPAPLAASPASSAPQSQQDSNAEANLHFAVKDSDTYLESSNAAAAVSGGLAVPVGGSAAGFLSPRVRARMNDLGLRDTDLAGVAGTGAGGRVSAQDLERYLDSIASWPSVQASPMRMAVADAMRRSCSRPLATVGLPLPMDRILEHRSAQSPKPGITLYMLRALALTLAEDPSLAGNLVGNRIVLPKSIDLGVAVQIDDGVVVPVLRGVDRKSLRELVDDYDEAVSRARRRRLTEADTSGGIGTVTNFGGFGVTSGTPIPLPHETLILGMAAAVKKPVWSDEVGAFLPATVSNLFLTFDHRVMDGIGAGRLMTRVAEWLATPAKL